jgi:LAGLIDADG DNA endonuclease family/NADH dehydrogenase
MINLNLDLFFNNLIFSLIDVLAVIIPVLMAIAFMTILERKQLAAHQRRVGPDTVGYFGVLQPFSDAMKLILKETIIPVMCYRKTQLWDKLSNSGDLLKLMILSYIWKVISGWTNHSCKVISQMMKETEMEYCGSKSGVIFVKEQRVDGSCWIDSIQLRCTLMGYENSYQVKILSKQLNKSILYFFTLINKTKNNSWFLDNILNNSKFLLFKYPVIQFTNKTSIKKENLNLVKWGTNLTSTVCQGRFTKQIFSMIQLPPNIESVIIGLLLSDGFISFSSSSSKNARLGFEQSLANFGYLWSVFILLSHYCSSFPHLVIRKRSDKITYSLKFYTRSMPCFTELHKIFYEKNIKLIPTKIYNLLSPLAFSHMIMGDGTKLNQGLSLCTESYSIKDNLILLNVLIIRYNLYCTLHKRNNSYRIHIHKRSMPFLRTIVKPYIIKTMEYKIN